MRKGLMKMKWFTVLAFTLCLLASGPVFAQGKVDINQATPKELMSLKGVGEQKAKAIVKYRQMNGPFGSIDDLKQVQGVGDKIISDNRGKIAIGKAAKPSKRQKQMIGAHEKAKKDKAKKEMAGAKNKDKKKMTGTSSKAKKTTSSKANKAKKTMNKKKK